MFIIYHNSHARVYIGKKDGICKSLSGFGKTEISSTFLSGTNSLSLCVLEDGTDSTCTNSSLLLVSRTQLKENNGYSLIVNKLPNISTNCTTTDKKICAIMGGSCLPLDYLDEYKTTVKVCMVKISTTPSP